MLTTGLGNIYLKRDLDDVVRITWLEQGMTLCLSSDLVNRALRALEELNIAELELREYDETGDHVMLAEAYPNYIKLVRHAGRYMVIAGLWRQSRAEEVYVALLEE
ncbi:MAG: hypothetical protein J7L75_01820 [Thermoproteales archaeon]|nr:hypothetical protein [Thermoproteales archaeon]